jgi:intracellular multiplication protein IcmV
VGFFRTAGRGFAKTFLNVPAWLSFKQLKQNTEGLLSSYRSIQHMDEGIESPETFEQAVKRLKLTDAGLKKYIHQLAVRAVVFFTMSILGFIYTVFMFYSAGLLAGIATLLISLILFIIGFFAHFYRFQITHRKLGCSFKEYFSNRIDGEKGAE